MTPKEKAAELIVNYQLQCKSLDYQQAKQCALVAVDEIIDILELNGFTLQEYHDKGTLEYWLHVKDEIQNL